MRIINTATANPAILDTMGRLAFYSGMDNLTLFEIHEGLSELMDDSRWETYRFEMELQAALLEMSFNGVHVDQKKRKELTREFQTTRDSLTELLNDMLEAIGYFDYYIKMAVHKFAHKCDLDPDSLPRSWDEWKARPVSWRRAVKEINEDALKEYHKALKGYDEFNPNSPAQKLRLFFHFFGRPDNEVAAPYYYAPPWLKTYGVKEHKARKANGEYGPTSDREALEKVIKGASLGNAHAAFWAAPFAKVCLEIADVAKSLQFLSCKLEDGMFRSSFGAVTDTGRLSSRKNAMDFGWNAQNVTPKLRVIFTCPKGYKLAANDYEQIESRNVGAICFTRFDADAYLNASECGDLHTLVCSMVWDNMGWPSDFNLDYLRKHGPFPKDLIKAAKKIAGGNFYRHFSYRDAVKRLGHGSNYCGKPQHMAMQTHIPKDLVEHFQSAYFTAFPEIQRWHNWVAEQLQVEGEITTLFGRSRRFFGRPNDDSVIRKAVAYEPQSMAADYTNRALLRIYHAHKAGLPIELFLQKHDEIGFRFLETDETKVMPIICNLMEEKRTLTSPSGCTREWYVPVEAESGWNLGFGNDDNPNGLMHPNPARIRQADKHWKEWKL